MTTRGSAEPVTSPLSAEELRRIDAYWRAANYLSVGQIYLLDNPLLTEPLRLEHIKPRLLGHWGTTPGLNLIYAHANRVIKGRPPTLQPVVIFSTQIGASLWPMPIYCGCSPERPPAKIVRK